LFVRFADFRRLVTLAMIFVLLLLLALSTACGHSKQARVEVPPPPALSTSSSEQPSSSSESAASGPAANGSAVNVATRSANSSKLDEADIAEPTLSPAVKPLVTEVGMASWYGPPYHNRVGSNGEVYNMHAMTAAHRTFPLGSIVRVTNVKTGHSALVRITDRGPFIPGRILDLSLAAARKVDVWQPGVAQVKVELMEAPAPIDSGGKWAVQIGGFPDEEAATKLAHHLTRRYRTAKVQSFASPTGDWWIRVRVLDDDHKRAEQLAAETETPEGTVFLVRLD
jgi:rare lipoprotein A